MEALNGGHCTERRSKEDAILWPITWKGCAWLLWNWHRFRTAEEFPSLSRAPPSPEMALLAKNREPLAVTCAEAVAETAPPTPAELAAKVQRAKDNTLCPVTCRAPPVVGGVTLRKPYSHHCYRRHSFMWWGGGKSRNTCSAR